MLLSWMFIAMFISHLVTIESKEDQNWSCYEKMLLAYKEVNSFNWTKYADYLTQSKSDIGWVVKVPHLGAKEYIDTLIAYVCCYGSTTLITGGPKDTGKSKGISSVHCRAIKVGLTVFELNLKGTIEETNIKMVVYDLAWDITEVMTNVEDNENWHVCLIKYSCVLPSSNPGNCHLNTL